MFCYMFLHDLDLGSLSIHSRFTPTDSGNYHFIIMVDSVSCYCGLPPIPDESAESVALAFKNHIICRHTSPETILSYNGLEFDNSFFSAFSTLCNCQKNITVVYHSQVIVL